MRDEQIAADPLAEGYRALASMILVRAVMDAEKRDFPDEILEFFCSAWCADLLELLERTGSEFVQALVKRRIRRAAGKTHTLRGRRTSDTKQQVL